MSQPPRRRFLKNLSGLAPLTLFASCGGGGGGNASNGGTSGTTTPPTGPTIPSPTGSQVAGLLFPGDSGANRRFRRTLPGQSIPAPFPLTVTFQVYPQDKGFDYQTIFFHGIEGPFDAANYYGAGPYRYENGNIREERWEIGAFGIDHTDPGYPLVYDRWFNCALIAWADATNAKHIRFYHDVSDPSRVIAADADASVFNALAPTHSFTWGDAPWEAVTNGNKEQFKGIMRRLKIFTTDLSLDDAFREASADGIATAAGAASVWYLNDNPQPDDLSDHSGKGHDFSWYDPNNTALAWRS